MTTVDARPSSVFEKQPGRLRLALIAFLGVLPAILCLIVTMTVHSFTLERELHAQVKVTHDRTAAVSRVFSLMQDAEAGQRGYLLTNEAHYLAPYDNAAREIPEDLRALQLGAAKSSQDQLLIDKLGEATQAKLAEISDTIRLEKSGRSGRALDIVRSDRGQTYMLQIRDLVAAIQRSSDESIASQQRRADGAFHQTMLFGLTLCLLFAVTLAGAGTIIQKTLQHRQRLFRSLEEVAKRQTAIFDSAVDAIVTVNPSGTIETINPAGERMFGRSADVLVRRDLSVLLDLGTQAHGTFLNRLGFGVEGAPSLIVEAVAIDRGGRKFPVDVALGPMQLETGLHVVACVRDISERKRVQQIKNDFISAVSHELRTPLTSITGSLGLLDGGAIPDMPDKAQRLVSIAHANSQRLGRLVNDIVDMEKIQSGQASFKTDTFDLKAVFRKVAAELDGYAAQYGVKILPQGDDRPLWARGDAEKIGQVAANLITNAAKFSPEGGTARIAFGRTGDTVQVSVSDDGPGIPEAFRPRMFNRFAQADNADNRQRGGAGLGLAIAKAIVDHHAGQLFFKSEAGKGAQFFLHLPAATSGSAPAPKSDGFVTPARLPRVLVCEDDPEVGEFLNALVKAEGGEPELVHSLQQARVALTQGRYASALLDVNLPDGSGLDLLKTFRQASGLGALPVVIVSAQERIHLQRSYFGMDVVDWVQKPINPSQLRKSLRAAIEQSRLRDIQAKPVILHTDDDPDLLELVSDLLKDAGLVIQARSVAAAKHALATRKPDLVILDVGLADGSGLELLPFLSTAKGGRIPTIVFSAQDTAAKLGDVDVVLTKSRASLGRLAVEVHALLDKTKGKHLAAVRAA